MYLTHSLILNSGPIADLEFKAPFNDDGTPKPVILVGTNGSGKTNVLSVLADALVEAASLHLSNVMPEIRKSLPDWEAVKRGELPQSGVLPDTNAPQQ